MYRRRKTNERMAESTIELEGTNYANIRSSTDVRESIRYFRGVFGGNLNRGPMLEKQMILKYEELEIEREVGKGAYGVVYK
jgi:hypothetical protein